MRTTLLMMVIICFLLATVFYAFRVPVIRNEVYGWLGLQTSDSESRQTAHLTFLLLTYSAPLLLATLLGIVNAILRRWYRDQDEASQKRPASPWDEEQNDDR